MSNTIHTRGHLSGSGGIRGHSAGSVFPYVIVAQGTPDNLIWYVLGNGLALHENSIPYASYEAAEATALNLKLMGA